MKNLRPRQPQRVYWTMSLESVNDGRPGAEQTETEGAEEKDIKREHQQAVVYKLFKYQRLILVFF